MKMILKLVFQRDFVGLVQSKSRWLCQISRLFLEILRVWMHHHTKVTRHIDHEVEELRFERNSGGTLKWVLSP